MAEKLKKDEKPKVKLRLDIKTLHNTILADAKFLEKFDPKRKEVVLSMKSKKGADDKAKESQVEVDPKKKGPKK